MIGIIGGGISGLSLAYFLQKSNIPYILFESSSKAGGLINTTKSNNYILETGPNSVLCGEEILEFIKELGLENEIQYPAADEKNRFIVRNGKLTKLPSGPQSLLLGNFFSFKSKIKIFKEYFNKTQSSNFETIASFFNRRFGNEVTELVINPLVNGIYAGDSSRLLMKYTFKSILEYEKTHNSVIKGFIKNKGSKRKISLNFKNGMESLPFAIASKLSNIQYDTKVSQISPQSDGFLLNTNKGEFSVSKLVLSIPSYECAKILVNIDPEICTQLNKIEYAVTSGIYSVYKKSDITNIPSGFGALNPTIENRFTSGTIWTSALMPNRCSEDEVLFTTFVAGEEKAMLPDEELLEKVHEDLKEIYQIKNKPVFNHIKRWSRAIPQYTFNVTEAYRLLPKLERRGIYINSNWKDGVSLSDRILNSKDLAKIIDKI